MVDEPERPKPIEQHPDYEVVKWQHNLEKRVMGYDLEASRWVSDLLAKIISNWKNI